MNRGQGHPAVWLAGAAAAYFTVVLALLLIPDRTLGHDEAVYAVAARGLWSGHPGDTLDLHRSIGMRVVAAPGVLLGLGERGIRFPFALIAGGYLCLVFAIARRHSGLGAAALAIAVQVTMAPWLWRAAEALSDIPSALALLGLTWLCASDAGRPRSLGRAVAAGALAAAACYVRYASAPAVAIILTVAFVGDPDRRRWLVAVAAVALVLLTPFFVWSAAVTGSPLGVLVVGDAWSSRVGYGLGLIDYLRAWPFRLAGPLAGAVAAIGLIVGLAAWRPGLAAATSEERARRLLATAAIGQIVVLGWQTHGEPRFVFFAVTALVIVGAGWIAGQRRRWIAAAIAVGLSAVPTAVLTFRHLRHLHHQRVPLREAVAAIDADAAGRPCRIFTTEAPITRWYSTCRALRIDGWGIDPARAAGSDRVYLVEVSRLRYSIGSAEAATRAILGWQPMACADPTRWCVWRATTVAEK